jgi:hypothetical protein
MQRNDGPKPPGETGKHPEKSSPRGKPKAVTAAHGGPPDDLGSPSGPGTRNGAFKLPFADSRGKLAKIAPKPQSVAAGGFRMFSQMFSQVRKAGPGGMLLTEKEREKVRAIRQKQREVRGLYNARLHAKQEDYTTPFTLTVATTTWNVAEHTPNELREELAELFHAYSLPDVIAISLQEVDMSPMAMTAGTTDKTAAWEAHVTAQLFHCMPTVRYVRITGEALVGLMLLVYVQKKHEAHVVHKALSRSTAGSVLAVVGNKGGIASRFTLYGKRYCIIGCHLPAHTDAVDKRNEAYHAMLRDFRFKLPVHADDLLDRGLAAGSCTVDVGSTVPLARWERVQVTTAPDHDYLFWIGDLNYRVTLPNDAARDLIARGDFAALLEADQLAITRRRGEAFVGFTEGAVRFAPTYKLDPGTDIYDSSPKCRTPSWTDRVLYACREHDPAVWAEIRATLKVAAPAADPFADTRAAAPRDGSGAGLRVESPRESSSTSPGASGEESVEEDDTETNSIPDDVDASQGHIRQMVYQSHPQYRLSDHRPVSALFEARGLLVDHLRFAALVGGIKALVEPMESHIACMIQELYP